MKRLVLLALVGCGSAPAATYEYFGPQVEPPRGLAKIHPGMTSAEAKRLVPGLKEPDTKGVRDELVLDSGVSNITLEVRFDGGAVSSIVAVVKEHTARDMLERAWGQPEITRDSLGQPVVTWVSERSGWKVKLDCLERNCNVEYLPYHVLTTEFFGAHVVPPEELAKLRIGMKLSEAKQLAPGLVSARNGVALPVDQVKAHVGIDDRSATIKMIYLEVPASAEALITEAWGPPADATDGQTFKKVAVWHDFETGWRATLRGALGTSKDLLFENYLPVTQLLGDQPDTLAGLHTQVLGKTVDEIKRAYKDDVSVVIPNKELEIMLPPTEWGGPTKLELAIAGGKVAKLEFPVPWKAYPEDRELILSYFQNKWGDPKQIEDQAGKPVLLFREDDPRVEVREEKDRGAWSVTMK